MKKALQFYLSRYPHLYRQLILLKDSINANLDKLVFLTIVSDGDVVFDVGANVGDYAVLFANIVGPNGQVHAFEPVSETFGLLSSRTTSEARFNNVFLNNTAAGESNSSSQIFVPGDDSGQASLAEHSTGAWSNARIIKRYPISIVSIDSYVATKKIAKLDFVKIDTEGYELMCLRGAMDTLTRYHPTIYLEVCNSWSKEFGYCPADLIQFLGSLGYSAFFLVTDKILKLTDPLTDILQLNERASANLICTFDGTENAKLEELSRLMIF